VGLPLAAFLSGEPAGSLTPERYASRLAPLADMGVVILGGGPGVGPAHVALLVNSINREEK
jgi:hypothetical protein